MNWLLFSLMTVACWGVYGIFLHKGAIGMGDPENGRYKAFLFVGIAYFLVAIVAPLIVLLVKGANWEYPKSGMSWSLVAGIVGAMGAFGVLLAFGAKGSPAVVMSIIFAGAPVINGIVAIAIDSKIKWGSVPIPFYLGIVLAAVGGCLVTLFKPAHPPAKKPEVEVVQKVE